MLQCDPILTVLGLRPEPPHGASDQARDRYAAREPAWRLLHAVTLLKLHQARTTEEAARAGHLERRSASARLRARRHCHPALG